MRRCFLVALLLAAAACLPGQAQVASATIGPYIHIWAGAEYANFRPDWGIPRLPGATVFTDFAIARRYGLEGEARFLTFTKPDGLTEKSYLGGPYFQALRWKRWTGNAKFLIGAGTVNYTSDIGYGSYFDYASGGVLEYRLAHKWKARFDYEYQFLPAAPGLAGFPNHGLTPNGFSGGIAYRIR